MNIIKKKADLAKLIHAYKTANKFVGFVPTMGALHEGHLSLIEKSNEQCDITVVSIFVNPTQFNNKADLEKYPRNIEQDKKLLLNVGCNILFYPDEKEMYPEPDNREFNFGDLETVMEGEFRPGHFNGVAQIVSKLFDAVQPDKAFFGEKDFQQLAVIRELVRRQNYPIQIISCATVRETDGLAMSSRNERLTKKQRQVAPIISKTLFEAKKMFSEGVKIEAIKRYVTDTMNKGEDMSLEYFDIVDSDSLQSVTEITDSKHVTACIALHLGEVRLIDNVIFF